MGTGSAHLSSGGPCRSGFHHWVPPPPLLLYLVGPATALEDLTCPGVDFTRWHFTRTGFRAYQNTATLPATPATCLSCWNTASMECPPVQRSTFRRLLPYRHRVGALQCLYYTYHALVLDAAAAWPACRLYTFTGATWL